MCQTQYLDFGKSVVNENCICCSPINWLSIPKKIFSHLVATWLKNSQRLTTLGNIFRRSDLDISASFRWIFVKLRQIVVLMDMTEIIIKKLAKC